MESVSITSGMAELVTVVSQVFTLITSNPLLLIFVAGGLVGVGITIFKKLKGAAK